MAFTQRSIRILDTFLQGTVGRPTAAKHLGPEAPVRTVEEQRAEPAALGTSPSRRGAEGKPR